MKVYLKITYNDNTVKNVTIRQTPNMSALTSIIEHYKSMRSVKDVVLDIK